PSISSLFPYTTLFRSFFLMHQVPGGPFAREKKLPQHVLDNLNAKYNLDAPVWRQYLDYMGDLVVPKITTGEYKFSVTDDHLINIDLPFGDNTTLRWMNFGRCILTWHAR